MRCICEMRISRVSVEYESILRLGYNLTTQTVNPAASVRTSDCGKMLKSDRINIDY